MTYKLYFRHFHFPVRRTGAYRHKKALLISKSKTKQLIIFSMQNNCFS